MRASILVVDDEESIRFTFETFLVDEGYSVATAESVAQAMARLEEATFDLLIIDVFLHDSSGIELLKEVRRRELGCPVILMTGYPNYESEVSPGELGATGFLSKPVTEQVLLNTTRRVLALGLRGGR